MTRKTRAWLVLAGILLVALLGYVAAGPWLAMNGIRKAVHEGDYAALSRHVDFARLRESLRPQLRRRIDRGVAGGIGPGEVSQALGGVTAMIAEPAIDAMVSPVGIAALLQGQAMVKRVAGDRDPDGQFRADNPLRGARAAYRSPSLFTAIVHDDAGNPLVFEFRRDGLAWKLVGLQLPD